MSKFKRCPNCRKKNKKKFIHCYNCGHEFLASVISDREAYSKPEPIEPPSPVLKPIFEPEDTTIEATLKVEEVNAKKSSFFSIVMEKIIDLTFHIHREVFPSLKNLLIAPGESLRRHAKGKDPYKASITYFLVFVAVYALLSHLVLMKLGFPYQLSVKFNNYVTPFILLSLLLIIALIGYITLGWRLFNASGHDDYTFSEVFVICLYIYGTNYFLAPYVVIASVYVDDLLVQYFPHDTGEIKGKITDIPLALFMMYMLFRLIKKTPNFKYLYPRFAAFLLLSYGYYFFMFRNIEKLQEWLSKFDI